MTAPLRPWLPRFSDSAALSDLRSAAESCMRSICECEPADCHHVDNRMTPLEFMEWIEVEIHRAGLAGQRTTMSRELSRAGSRRTQRQLESASA